MKNKHTYDLGLIGNGSYLAYIDKSANVVWQCWPKFDSSFIFGSLLDGEKGGQFIVTSAADQFESKQFYIENTNILCTEFIASDGRFRVLDFAPRFFQYGRYYKPLMMARKIEPLQGTPRIKISCRPSGGYGSIQAEASFGSNHIRFLGLEEQVRLTSNAPLNYIHHQVPFLLTESQYLCLTWGAPLEAPLESTLDEFLHKTTDYWHTWVEHCSIPDFCQKEVIRSALALKLHQYEDTGAIIASGTTSLTESPGSGRNWDYRYCWIRDSYYTLNAFRMLGHFEELGNFSHFLQNLVVRQKDRIPPVFTLLGDSEIPESELDLAGYQGEKPVRVGNAAYQQVQNDVYGQMILSILPLYVDQRIIRSRRLKDVQLVERILNLIEQTMNEPDAGLWELRGSQHKHAYTFLFHWAGCQAALRIGNYLKVPSLVKKAKDLSIQASKQLELCFNSKFNAYTSYIGSQHHDASLFQLVTMNYLNPCDPKALHHIQALEEALKIKDGFVYRYRNPDDFGQPEAAFLVCGFWYVSALAAVGRVDEAFQAFEGLLQSQNHLGLLSEDVDPLTGSQWGNFVQTYSHVGVINAAFDLARKKDIPNFLNSQA